MTVSASALERLLRARAAVHQREPKLLHSGAVNASAAARQRPRHIRRRLNQRLAAQLVPETTSGRLAALQRLGDLRRQRQHCFGKV